MPKGKGPGAPYGNKNAAGPHKGGRPKKFATMYGYAGGGSLYKSPRPKSKSLLTNKGTINKETVKLQIKQIVKAQVTQGKRTSRVVERIIANALLGTHKKRRK